MKLIANNDRTKHDYLLLSEDVQFVAQWFTSTHEEKEILESFSCELFYACAFICNRALQIKGTYFTFEKSVIYD